MAASRGHYPEKSFTRPALAPAILAAMALMAGAALLGSEWFIVVRFAVAILVAVMGVFAVQARAYAWLVVIVPVVVAWNPVFPLTMGGAGWAAAHLIAPIALVIAGFLIKVPATSSDRSRR
ncbi:DUF6804 family protein [Paramicrobacterium agarici]|uniref:DUF6804 family protein n=1 Tax=Paramicrobacterium agarici TaxID=630514 RepID=UPI0011521C25|nr:DUF6804 family protein [Microbacterium agarici]TQO24054.1 hypothetical protein FB385_2924 [Microbacterium agarici]